MKSGSGRGTVDSSTFVYACRGRTSIPVTIYALRKDDFAGEIAISLKNAPAGFTLSGAKIPAHQDQVTLTLKAPSIGSQEPLHLIFEGRATVQGQPVNPHHAALVAGLWAVQPKTPGAHAYTVDSPLQDSACKYGSSFSRAVEVDMGDHRRLTISGTASIDPAGKTAHLGDVAAQVDLTMRVVRAILNSRGMDWTDITRGLVYFRRPEDLPFYERWRRFNEAPLMPVIVTNHTVCRDDLLYEIELDAVSERGSIVAPPRAYEKNRTSRRPDVPTSTSLA